jgi:hypothetical protein
MPFLASIVLLSGYYVAVSSSGPELCPHQVRVRTQESSMEHIRVSYSGDCADQGPFRYDCFYGGPAQGPEGTVCLNNNIEFEITSPESYIWRNRDYGIVGHFVRSNAPF